MQCLGLVHGTPWTAELLLAIDCLVNKIAVHNLFRVFSSCHAVNSDNLDKLGCGLYAILKWRDPLRFFLTENTVLYTRAQDLLEKHVVTMTPDQVHQACMALLRQLVTQQFEPGIKQVCT